MNTILFYEFGKRRDVVFNFDTNLVAYYKFDGDLIDSKNGNNGSSTGPGTITYGAGKINNSFSLKFNVRASFPQTTNMDFSDAVSDIPFSMSFVFKRTDTAFVELFNKRGASAGTDQWSITQANGVIELALFSNSTTAYIGRRYTSSQFSSNVFIHCIITYDGSGSSDGIKMYHNGNLLATTAIGAGVYTKMPIASQVTRINSLNNANGGYGRLDELYVWKNRVISAEEVSDAYAKLNAGVTLI